MIWTEGLAQLEALEQAQLKLVHRVLEAYDSALYPMDLLTMAAVNRSLALSSGFRQMIAAKNLVCAGSILRLQIDTAARYSAAWRVKDPHEFALAVLKGSQVRDMLSTEGRRMTDRYLVQCLVPDAEWVERVYERTSGYIHLSATHFMASLSVANEDGTFSGKISAVDKPLPEELYEEAVEAFIAASELLMKYVQGWGVTKDNPDAVKAGRPEQ